MKAPPIAFEKGQRKVAVMKKAENHETPSLLSTPRRPCIAGLVIALLNSLPLSAGTPPPLTEEERRVSLVEQLERSVVLVFAEGRGVTHARERLSLEPTKSLGTGLVISADGLVLTAAHVVEEAQRLKVKLGDGEPVPARTVFADEEADIALLRLETAAPGLQPATLGDSDRVRKGEAVYVIGNPVGIERSLSVGVVSGRHPFRHVFGGNIQVELIQTDAAINSGNSGGPIFNSRGEVIAIAQRILTEGGGSEGLGFGLAINVVKKILALDPCTWLGFSAIPLDEPWSRVFNTPRQGGVLLQRVAPGGPAFRAGLRGGDVPIQVGNQHFLVGGDIVLTVDGEPAVDWVRRASTTSKKPGDLREFNLKVYRAGQTVDVPVATVHRSGW